MSRSNTSRLRPLGWAFAFCLLGAMSAAAEEAKTVRIEVFPPNVKLATPQRRMHVAVTGFDVAGRVTDLTEQATLESLNPAVAEVRDRVIVPVADGVTEIRVTAAGN